MTFPSLTDIIAAAKDSRFIKHPFFENSSISLNSVGQPYMISGGFSQVFKISKDGADWAFKVWKVDLEENEKRYEMIREFLISTGLPYFVDFEYASYGLLVNGFKLPTLRMPWMDADLLKIYINKNVNNPYVLSALAENFLIMTKHLHDHGISHGDLKNDNIFVLPEGEIKLIDYDSLYIPSLEGAIDTCHGTDGYQHPLRLMYGFHSSSKVDHFSELVIYLSIRALAENPLLWQIYHIMQADYRLLFTKEDFINFRYSNIRRDLMTLSTDIQQLVKLLDEYLAAHLLLPAVAG